MHFLHADTTDDAAFATDDRDLVALVNEARNPQDLERAVQAARLRRQGRRRDAAQRTERPARGFGARLALGRRLSFRV